MITLLAATAKPSHLLAQKAEAKDAQSLREEHAALQTGLREALASGGRTEAAARELAQALDLHIKRDEQVILPLLAMSPGNGKQSPKRRADAAEMAEDLAKEEARIADEQVRFSAILYKLRDAAREEHKPRIGQFAEIVQLHMEKEAQVYLPKVRKVASRFRVDSKEAH